MHKWQKLILLTPITGKNIGTVHRVEKGFQKPDRNKDSNKDSCLFCLSVLGFLLLKDFYQPLGRWPSIDWDFLLLWQHHVNCGFQSYFKILGWKSVSDTVWVMSPTVFREEKALRLLRIWSGWMQNQGLGAGTEKLHGDRKAVTAIINYIQVQW